jgi:ethanolamine utilization microcompartment shell protein EutL
MLGFVAFVVLLPRAADPKLKTDVIVVPTGGVGRTARGAEILEAGSATRMFISGVALAWLIGPFGWESVWMNEAAHKMVTATSHPAKETNFAARAVGAAPSACSSSTVAFSELHTVALSALSFSC